MVNYYEYQLVEKTATDVVPKSHSFLYSMLLMMVNYSIDIRYSIFKGIDNQCDGKCFEVCRTETEQSHAC